MFRRGLLYIVVALVCLPVSAFADFSLDGAGLTSSGSGDAVGTAFVVNEGPFYVGEPGFYSDADIDPTGAVAFQQSEAYAWDGTAAASTSGAITETAAGVNEGDSVTATVQGSTSAAAQKENDPVREDLANSAISSITAAGGSGTVLSSFFNTETGVIFANADSEAVSTGSIDATAGTDAAATTKGSALVEYTFAGAGSPETASVTDVVQSSDADVDDDTTVDNPSVAVANTNTAAVVGWTDSPTEGQAFGSFVAVQSNAVADTTGSDMNNNGLPVADAASAGNADLAFTYRPIANPVFSFLGNAGGSTDASAEVTQNEGFVYANGEKAAVGVSGTQTDLPPGAYAWIVGSVHLAAEEEPGPVEFAGRGTGHAVNPAALGDADVDPDPSMTVGTQYGNYSASMGSSSLTNAEVTAEVDMTPSGGDSFLGGDEIIATAFGFAVANRDGDLSAAAGAPPVTLFDLSSEHAFVGQGSLVGADDGNLPNDPVVNATAEALNLYGAASSPSFYGTMENGDSSAAVAFDEDLGAYVRSSSASADTVTGTNYPVAVSHSQLGGAFDQNAPWWTIFAPSEPHLDDLEFTHLTFGFVGGGGN